MPKSILNPFTASLCLVCLMVLGVAAQTALEPRIGALELNQTSIAQTLSPLVTLASVHTQEACARQAGGCNPVFSTATTIGLTPRPATPSPYPPLETPEAWCRAIVNGNPLNARDVANGRVVVTQIPYNAIIAFDQTTKTTLGGYTWVQLRDPVRYNGLWVALSLLRGVQC